MRLFGMRKFSKMSSDIVYQMEWFTNLVGYKPDTAEVIAAKAKKVAITTRCAKEQTDVDIEIIDAKAKVQPVAKDADVKQDKDKSLLGAPVKVTDDTKLKALGGKSNKKKFSKKRKGGKRAKSQKKRR